MESLQAEIFSNHSGKFFTFAASVLALSLTSTPTFLPLVILLSILRVYIAVVTPRAISWAHVVRIVALWLPLTLAISLAHLLPSLHALSTPVISILSLLFLSATSSAIALALILLDNQISARVIFPWSIALFPAIWATVWYGVSYISPLGRLITWTPIHGLESYAWMAQFTGPIGTDWVVAAWAVVVAYLIQNWFGGDTQKEEPLIQHELPAEASTCSKQSYKIILLTIVLVVLTLPSFISNDLPLSPFSSDATPLTVGCVLPSSRSQQFTPTLDDFIAESKKMTKAKVLLWPEGAVKFNSPSEKEDALNRVRREVRGPYIGVSFEDFVPSDSHGGNGRSGMRRTGVSIVTHDSDTILLSYYKRQLVPIAESFSLAPSADPPTIYTLELSHPSDTSKTDWAPGPNYTRPIPLSASICLDYAQPSTFAALDSRPSLVLAPARTWHTSVGIAMWEQARLRAEEIGSMVLWCDGGEGGVSGIAGGGMNDITQVGPGSWTRTIGVQWPFKQRRTVYAQAGDYPALLLCWVIVGVGWMGRPTLDINGQTRRVRDIFRHTTKMVHGWRRIRGVNQGESQPLLL